MTVPSQFFCFFQKQGPSNTLGYILRDVRPHIPRGYMYTLHDIGLVINKLMGGAYRLVFTYLFVSVVNIMPDIQL